MASTTLIFTIALLVTVASAADPTCSTGTKAGGACCPAGCGKCGGADCGERSKMLKLQCCIGAIKNKPANCLTADPPCKITTMDPDFMAGSDIPDPECKSGLTMDKACCPPECSVCGGSDCAARGALIKSDCCPESIEAGTRGCIDTGAPCTLFKKSTVPMESAIPGPMESAAPMMSTSPSASPMETPKRLPRKCTSTRSKFLGGCFCYLVVSAHIRVRKAKYFRMHCRKEYGTKKKILSKAFECRRFKSGSKAAEKVMSLIKRLNALITLCDKGLPMIEERM